MVWDWNLLDGLGMCCFFSLKGTPKAAGGVVCFRLAVCLLLFDWFW